MEHLIGFGQLEFMDAILFDCVERAWKWLPVALAQPGHAEARSQMAWASHHALCNGGSSNAHAIAQSIGGVYHEHHFVHGHACAIALPAAIRWHADTRAGQIRRLADCFGVPYAEGEENQTVANRVADAVLNYYKACGLPTLQETFRQKKITDTKEEFLQKMVPAVKQDSLVGRFLPPIHTDDAQLTKILEMVWNDI